MRHFASIATVLSFRWLVGCGYRPTNWFQSVEEDPIEFFGRRWRETLKRNNQIVKMTILIVAYAYEPFPHQIDPKQANILALPIEHTLEAVSEELAHTRLRRAETAVSIATLRVTVTCFGAARPKRFGRCHRSRYRLRWRSEPSAGVGYDSEMDNEPNVSGDFTPSDVETLVTLAKRPWWAKWLWGPVISISRQDEGARITTGKVYGPLCGHGWYFNAKKINGTWKIVGRCPWKS
jgi:hypothetical protein